ncbi:MAG: hypothetical protein J6U66_06060 [Lachnospiraceae bacterium]|nr:hypothetical protein [Lachnospiraceae bacterium]
MAKRNTLRLELSGFDELITKLEGLQGEVKEVVTDALMQAAETIEEDTKDAMARRYLPAQGRYSTGETVRSIVKPSVVWSGPIAETGVGFDYSKPGAGGFLITGTPRMAPNRELNRIYRKKAYVRQIQADMEAVVMDAIDRTMEGKK